MIVFAQVQGRKGKFGGSSALSLGILFQHVAGRDECKRLCDLPPKARAKLECMSGFFLLSRQVGSKREFRESKTLFSHTTDSRSAASRDLPGIGRIIICPGGRVRDDTDPPIPH